MVLTPINFPRIVGPIPMPTACRYMLYSWVTSRVIFLSIKLMTCTEPQMPLTRIHADVYKYFVPKKYRVSKRQRLSKIDFCRNINIHMQSHDLISLILEQNKIKSSTRANKGYVIFAGGQLHTSFHDWSCNIQNTESPSIVCLLQSEHRIVAKLITASSSID